MPHTLSHVLPHTAKARDDGHLEVGGVDVVELAERFGTPSYIFCEQTFRERARAYREAYAEGTVYYAGKAFLTVGMAKMVAEEGLGMDVASGGELYTALKAGFPVERLVFHGNNKTTEELEMGLDGGVGCFVCDSIDELERLDELAGARGVRAPVVLRVTPGVEAHTHEFIQTGQDDSKFGCNIEGGVALEAAKRALDLPNLDLLGFHSHIGSNITGPEAFLRTAEIHAEFCRSVRDATGYEPSELNMGGGLGIAYTRGDYPAEVASFAKQMQQKVAAEFSDRGLSVPRLAVEPGRWLIANAMLTLYSVGVVKEIPGVRTYVSVDGGMSDNIRPSLYQARYEALIANRCNEHGDKVVTIAGSHCEQGDLLIRDIALPGNTRRGDLLAILATGAYGFSMASNYNRFRRPPVIVVADGRARELVRRETYEDLTARDL
ncbi:MAG: diaminopimelate decarboxylase [Actinomycetota bacterium]